MRRPDFALTDLSALEQRDIHFLMTGFPGNAGRENSGLDIVCVPQTLETVVESRSVFERITSTGGGMLDVSPFLLFNVLLRERFSGSVQFRSRRIMNYLANVLSLFVRNERVYRYRLEESAFEYITDMQIEMQRLDSNHRFLLSTHIGNYCLFLTGLFSGWLENPYRRRSIDSRYYINQGQAHYDLAASSVLAEQYSLREVLYGLAGRFEEYRAGLSSIAHEYLRQ